MSFIYGVLFTFSNLRHHNKDFSLVEHDESENVALDLRLAADAEEAEEDQVEAHASVVASELGESSSAPLPTQPPPVLGASSGTATGASSMIRQRKHIMSMIGGGVAVPLTTPDIKSTSAPPPRRGSYPSSTLIYTTSCFGASCLGMPWCFAQCGWGLALILLCLTALTTQWGAALLLQCAVKVSGEPSGGVSIKQVAIVASPHLASLPELVVVINCLGSAIGALVVSGFLLPRTFQKLASLKESFYKELMASTMWEGLLKERLLWRPALVLPPRRHASQVCWAHLAGGRQFHDRRRGRGLFLADVL